MRTLYIRFHGYCVYFFIPHFTTTKSENKQHSNLIYNPENFGNQKEFIESF